MENEWVFCEENLSVLVECSSSEPDVTFSIPTYWGRRQACLMLTYPFSSLLLPLNEDLCPCIMMVFSWGEPRLQAGPSDLAVDYRRDFNILLHLKTCLSSPPCQFILVRWGRVRRMSVEIPWSHRNHLPAMLSQHFVCLTGDVWKEPGSWKGQCWAFWKWLYFQLHWVGQSSLGLWVGSCGHVLPSSYSFHRAFPQPKFSELYRSSLAFLLSISTSSNQPNLFPSKDPLLPTTRSPKKVTGRRTVFDSSLSSLKCKKPERPRDHVGVCLPGRGLPCTLARLI